MNAKRILTGILAMSLMVVGFTACGSNNEGSSTGEAITVVSRDAASGTRGAFHEIMKVTVEENGNDVDKLVSGSLEFDGTDKVITAVEGDKNAIGYISTGSLSDRVKAVSIDGVEPTAENIKNGSYKVSRPFLMVTGKENVSAVTTDFISFTMSTQGQKIVADEGYIEGGEATTDYTATNQTGTIKISGSTSVAPVMEKLMEEYKKLNPGVTFEMQNQGSSQGVKDATAGTADIGLASRALKDDEAPALTSYTLANDGIAVIVNKESAISNITSDNVTKIYTGAVTTWAEVQ